MKNIKSIVIVAFVAIAMSFFIAKSGAFAEDIGVVDINKIAKNYSKAQEVISDLKVKESDLQKFVAEARRDLSTAKPDSRKILADKYNAQLKEKSANFKQEEIKELSVIQSDISKAIKTVADKKNIKTVFKSESMLMGAQDLTDDVISTLNASNTSVAPTSSNKMSTPVAVSAPVAPISSTSSKKNK